jgi:hypothetical protein
MCFSPPSEAGVLRTHSIIRHPHFALALGHSAFPPIAKNKGAMDGAPGNFSSLQSWVPIHTRVVAGMGGKYAAWKAALLHNAHA